MTTNTNNSLNNNAPLQGKPDPSKPTESNAQLPFVSNYMIALLNSLQTTTNNIYVQEKADADTLSMLQQYMQLVQNNQTQQINREINQATADGVFDDPNKTSVEMAKINMMQAEMSTEVDKANSAVGSMKSTLNNDITNASQILNFFEGLTTITGFTSGLLR